MSYTQKVQQQLLSTPVSELDSLLDSLDYDQLFESPEDFQPEDLRWDNQDYPEQYLNNN